jgi:hypothetical protein
MIKKVLNLLYELFVNKDFLYLLVILALLGYLAGLIFELFLFYSYTSLGSYLIFLEGLEF